MLMKEVVIKLNKYFRTQLVMMLSGWNYTKTISLYLIQNYFWSINGMDHPGMWSAIWHRVGLTHFGG